MIVDSFLMIISIVLSVFAITYLIVHRDNFGPKKNILLMILLYLFVGIFYFILLCLATIPIFNINVALILWNLSIIISLFAVAFLSSLQSIIIGYKKIEWIIALAFSLLGGIIISIILTINSFNAKQVEQNYYFIFRNYLLLYFMILLGGLLFFLMWYNLVKNYSKIREKKLARGLIINNLGFSIVIYTYCIFLLIQNVYFKYFHLISYLVIATIVLYEIIKKPDLFVELTNRIYDFIIFHKSGILLYSFNFETEKEIEDSILKGSILIGINHILANFIERFDQLNLIKMKNRDIIFEYNKTFDYAILITANKKTEFIERSIKKFMETFSNLNKEKLSKLAGLIDTSQFKNAGDLIHEFFKLYLK